MSLLLAAGSASGVVGTFSATQSPQTLSGYAGVAIGATGAYSNAAQSLSASSGVHVSGAATSTLLAQQLASSGSVTGGVSYSAQLDIIFAILTGRKVYDTDTKTWHVYDQNGVELVDASGILLQGLHGFLLRNQESVTGAAGFSQKKRRKNIVNIDGTLYEFNSEAEAISFINSIDEPKAEESKPEPIREVRISQVETLAKVFTIPDKQTEIYNDIQFANYADILAAYDRLIELEDEEILLLL